MENSHSRRHAPTLSTQPHKGSFLAKKWLWPRPPAVILLIKKLNDAAATRKLREVAEYLKTEHHIRVVVDAATQQEVPELESFTEGT